MGTCERTHTHTLATRNRHKAPARTHRSHFSFYNLSNPNPRAALRRLFFRWFLCCCWLLPCWSGWKLNHTDTPHTHTARKYTQRYWFPVAEKRGLALAPAHFTTFHVLQFKSANMSTTAAPSRCVGKEVNERRRPTLNHGPLCVSLVWACIPVTVLR